MATQRATGKDELRRVAHQEMLRRELLPDFSPAVIAETDRITRAAVASGAGVRDLRALLWASIDNDDSRDLDQLSVAESLAGGAVKIFVAIADVDALVRKDSAIDGHAWTNTTSVYTAAEIFPMLPEKLSTNLTSLGEGEERLAIVIEMTVAADGTVTDSDIYRATVLNRAKLAYNALAAWLDGHGARAAEARRGGRARRTAPHPGPRRASHATGTPRPRRAAPRDAGGSCRVRRRRALRSAARREEPCEGADRGLHGCGQWRHREISRQEGRSRRCAAC